MFQLQNHSDPGNARNPLCQRDIGSHIYRIFSTLLPKLEFEQVNSPYLSIPVKR